jgi:hypothetical protein
MRKKAADNRQFRQNSTEVLILSANQAWICDDGCVKRGEVADGARSWTADFSVPGEEDNEQETVDITLGTNGNVQENDADGDATQVNWRVPVPRLTVVAADDRVDGYEWPEGAAVTLSIDDLGTPENPDYVDAQTVIAAPWDPEVTWVGFEFGDTFDVQPGHAVMLTDGVVVKEHIVTNLMITSIDANADMVSGTANPGAEVNMWACDEYRCVSRNEHADAAGNWSADFSVPGDEDWEQEIFDIGPNTWGGVEEQDQDCDATHVQWDVRAHVMFVFRLEDRILGLQWDPGASVTLVIDDPATSQSPDYTDVQTVSSDRSVEFNPGDMGFDILAGHVVTLTDGVMTKEHVVTGIVVTSADAKELSKNNFALLQSNHDDAKRGLMT